MQDRSGELGGHVTLILAIALASAAAQTDRIELRDGTVLVGEIQTIEGDRVVVQHPLLGSVELSLTEVVALEWRTGVVTTGVAVERRDELRLADGTRVFGELVEQRADAIRFRTPLGELTAPMMNVARLIVRIDDWGPRTIQHEELERLLAELRSPVARTRATAMNVILFSEDPDAIAAATRVLTTAPGELGLELRGLPAVAAPGARIEGEAWICNVAEHGCWIQDPAESSARWRLKRTRDEFVPLPRNEIPFFFHRPAGFGIGIGGGRGSTSGGRFGRRKAAPPRILRRDPALIGNDIERYRWLASGQEIPCQEISLHAPWENTASVIRLGYELSTPATAVQRIRARWKAHRLPSASIHSWNGSVSTEASIACLRPELADETARSTAFTDRVTARHRPGGSLALELTSRFDPVGGEHLDSLSDHAHGWFCEHREHAAEKVQRGQRPCRSAFRLTPRFVATWDLLDPTFEYWYLIRDPAGSGLAAWGAFRFDRILAPEGWLPGAEAALQGAIEGLALPPGRHEVRVGVTFGSEALPIWFERATPWAAFEVPR